MNWRRARNSLQPSLMPFPEIATWTVATALTALLISASVSDFRRRQIPNAIVLAILVVFIPWAVLHWGAWAAWALLGGVISLAIGLVLYAMKLLGGGDAKLFAAVALFAGLEHLLALAAATALVGGAIAVVSLALQPRRALSMFILRGKGDFGRGIPYGVAISLAATLIVWAGILRPAAFGELGL